MGGLGWEPKVTAHSPLSLARIHGKVHRGDHQGAFPGGRVSLQPGIEVPEESPLGPSQSVGLKPVGHARFGEALVPVRSTQEERGGEKHTCGRILRPTHHPLSPDTWLVDFPWVDKGQHVCFSAKLRMADW